VFFFGLLKVLAHIYPTLTLCWFLFFETGAEGEAGAERAGLTVAATADSDMPPVSPRATSQGLLLHAHEGIDAQAITALMCFIGEDGSLVRCCGMCSFAECSVTMLSRDANRLRC
jgi:hypothetical protein